jgi:hypothetical protein
VLGATAPAQSSDKSIAALEVKLSPAGHPGAGAWTISVGDLVTLMIATPRGGMPLAVQVYASDGRTPIEFPLVKSGQSDDTGHFQASFLIPKALAGRTFEFEALAYDEKSGEILSSGRQKVRCR